MPALGFGFVEVGTVTPLRRRPATRGRASSASRTAESLQNRLGFNNRGMAALAARLDRLHPGELPLGRQSGQEPGDAAGGRPRRLPAAAPRLRRPLRLPGDQRLLAEHPRASATSRPPPSSGRCWPRRPRSPTGRCWSKIDPDLEPARAVDLCAAAVEAGAAGIVATNTTADLALVAGADPGGGGLSGRVLRGEEPRACSGALARELFGKTVLVSVGGVDSGAEAYRRIRAGASLVQLYTALVYRGPSLVGEINRDLLARPGRRRLPHPRRRRRRRSSTLTLAAPDRLSLYFTAADRPARPGTPVSGLRISPSSGRSQTGLEPAVAATTHGPLRSWTTIKLRKETIE